MLANQLPVPEVQVRQEANKASEIKSSRDTTRTRDFDRDMEKGRREQQGYDRSQETNKRQTDAKEATRPRQPEPKNTDKTERKEPVKEDAAVKQTSEKPVASDGKEQTSSETKENKTEHDCEHCADKEHKSAVVSSGKLVEQTAEQRLESAKESETSKWLDTILSLSSDTETDASTEANTGEQETTTGNEQISLAQLKDILASIGSNADLGQLEGQEQVSLAQLKAVLSDSEFKAVIATELDKLETEVSPEQEFEQLLAKLSNDGKVGNAEATEQKPAIEIKSVTDLVNQAKAAQQPKVAEQQLNTPVSAEQNVASKLVQVNASQADKTTLDKQESKFKQSSLVSAMQLGSETAETETQDQEPVKQTIAEMLSPTTKVVNIAGTPVANSEANVSLANNVTSAAAQVAVEQSQVNNSKLGLSELDMTEAASRDNSENKLASLLGTLAPEEVKTSDQSNRAEKVNVAGVTLDKTLQMPKIENMTQAKNEVVVRENILFNKQELATQMQTQVGMMMARNMKSVDIRLDPPELGSMQVKLSVQNDQASVSFVVSNQQAKDALENSLPKLKELLEQQGLQLADSDVHQQQSQAQSGGDNEEQGISQNGLNPETGEEESDLEQQQQMINRAINSPWNVSYYA